MAERTRRHHAVGPFVFGLKHPGSRHLDCRLLIDQIDLKTAALGLTDIIDALGPSAFMTTSREWGFSGSSNPSASEGLKSMATVEGGDL